MAYKDIYTLSQDSGFMGRVMACKASELVANSIPVGNEPVSWTDFNRWAVAAQPGFGDAYGYALNSDPPVKDPGTDPAVITDGMILAAVQALS